MCHFIQFICIYFYIFLYKYINNVLSVKFYDPNRSTKQLKLNSFSFQKLECVPVVRYIVGVLSVTLLHILSHICVLSCMSALCVYIRSLHLVLREEQRWNDCICMRYVCERKRQIYYLSFFLTNHLLVLVWGTKWEQNTWKSELRQNSSHLPPMMIVIFC